MIKFSCPHCKKTLKVADHLAGKKGGCPNPSCKKIIQIPAQTVFTPSSSSSSSISTVTDLEAMAAEALAEQKQQVVVATTIDLACPYCDENVKFPADMGGKQAPCPSCRRIVRVPMPQRTGPRDWRKPDEQTLPSGAKRADATPEGAWGTESVKGVSRAALVEAAVIKEEREPLSLTQWILYSTAAVVLLGGLTWGTFWWFGHSREKLEQSAVAIAENYLKDGKANPATQAELHRALGIYAQADGKQRLQQARLAAERIADPVERMGVVRELLNTHVDLHIDAEEMGAVLTLAAPGVFREQVVREIARRSLAGGNDLEGRASRVKQAITQGVPAVSRKVSGTTKDGGSELDASEQNACLAILGQELARAGRTDLAQQLADTLRTQHRPKDLFPAQLNALLVMLNKAEIDAAKEQEGTQLASRAEGAARAGLLAKANDTLQLPQFSTPTLLRMDTLLAIAETLLDKEQRPRAQELLSEAVTIMELFPDDTQWQRQRAVELSARAGQLDAAEQRASQLLTGPGLERARLAILRIRLTDQSAEANLVSAFAPTGSAYGVAIFELARIKAKADARDAMRWAESLDENAKPFAAAGVAVGMRN
jgi:hypothetical protein